MRPLDPQSMLELPMMTNRLKDLVRWLRSLPNDEQDRVADILLALAAGPYERD